MAIHVTLPRLRCARCGHVWAPRTETVDKCPRCQSLEGLAPLTPQTNLDAKSLIASASKDEIRDLSVVLQIMRDGDPLYAGAIERAMNLYIEQAKREARTKRVAQRVPVRVTRERRLGSQARQRCD